MSAISWFDAECCLGRTRVHRPSAPTTAEELVAELHGDGIDRALIYHADAAGYDPLVGNRELMEEIADHPEFEPCWVLLPHDTGEFPPPDEIVAEMLASGVRAARVFPFEFRFAFRLWNLGPLLARLAAHRIPLWVDFGHEGWSARTTDFDGIHEVCAAFPDLPVVLVRPNIGSDRWLFPLLRQHANLHVETSYYTVHRGIELLCKTFGPERALFGTGLPHRAPGPSITALAYGLIDERSRALVAGGNLARLLASVRSDGAPIGIGDG